MSVDAIGIIADGPRRSDEELAPMQKDLDERRMHAQDEAALGYVEQQLRLISESLDRLLDELHGTGDFVPQRSRRERNHDADPEAAEPGFKRSIES